MHAQHEQTNQVSDNGHRTAAQPSGEMVSSTPTSTMKLRNLRRQDVLQLQRLVGNRAVQRMVKAGHLTLRPSSVIQRADTPAASGSAPSASTESSPAETATAAPDDQGLLDDAAETRFARIIQTYASDPRNADVDLPAFATVLLDELNNELDVIGVPRTNIKGPGDDHNYGAFDHTTWVMDLNLDSVFGSSSLKVGELNQPQLLEAVHTVYHEGRHAEQSFLIARLRAADLLAGGKTGEEAKATLLQDLQYPENVIEQAVANPLKGASQETVDTIKEWDSDINGPNKDYEPMVRLLRQYKVGLISESVSAINDAVPADFTKIPYDQLAARLAEPISTAQARIKDFLDYRDTSITPLVNRLAATPVPATGQTDGDKAMREHMKNIDTMIDQIVPFKTIGPDPSKALSDTSFILTWASKFLDELHVAEAAFPEEIDANHAGDEVAKKFADAANGEE